MALYVFMNPVILVDMIVAKQHLMQYINRNTKMWLCKIKVRASIGTSLFTFDKITLFGLHMVL